MTQEPEKMCSRQQSGNAEPKTEKLLNSSSANLPVNSRQIGMLIQFGQLPLLCLPGEQVETGGVVFSGESPFGKMMPPMWLVTSYRLARN